MICLECNEEIGGRGFGHHLKKHKITKQEYAQKYATKEWITCFICKKPMYKVIRLQSFDKDGNNVSCCSKKCTYERRKRRTVKKIKKTQRTFSILRFEHICLFDQCGFSTLSSNNFSKHLINKHNISRKDYAFKFKTDEMVECISCKNIVFLSKNEQAKGVKTCKKRKCVNNAISLANKIIKNAPDKKEQRHVSAMKSVETRRLRGTDKIGVQNANRTKLERNSNIIGAQKAAKTLRTMGHYDSDKAVARAKKANQTKINNHYFESDRFFEAQERACEHVNSHYKTGKYRSIKTDELVTFQSSNEFIRFLQLDEDPTVSYWHKNSKRLRITYYLDDKKHSTLPDLLIIFIDGSCKIEEIKGRNTYKSQIKCAAVLDFCIEANICFEFIPYNNILTNSFWKTTHKKFLNEYDGFKEYTS
jgi:hypothetical protein